MPTNRAYPIEHYPHNFLLALRKAAQVRNEWHVAAEARSSREAGILHRKLGAMLKGFKDFPGQDARLTELAIAKRFQARKRWDARLQIVFIEVCSYERPSEQAAAYMEELKRKFESS